MSRIHVCRAIVLKVTDCGEADRFCILLTRERGRIAARARGVRRPGSRMAGHLLPLKLTMLELVEGKTGLQVTAARPLGEASLPMIGVGGFFTAERGVELLLRLLQDEEELPEVFDAAAAFLLLCGEGDPGRAFVPFALRLLHLLGLLPIDDASVRRLPSREQHVLRQAASALPLTMLAMLDRDDAKLEQFLALLLEEHLTSPLKAGEVALQFLGDRLQVTGDRTSML